MHHDTTPGPPGDAGQFRHSYACREHLRDGYALRAADLAAERCSDLRLPIAQRIAAGPDPQPLAPGTAAQIFTGASIPAGADTVVPQEDCTLAGDGLRLASRPDAAVATRTALREAARRAT